MGKLALLLLALCAPLQAAHAQMVLFSGNNQSGVVNTTLANPLQVRFSSASYVSLDWTVTGDATIQESGGATFSQFGGMNANVNRGDTFGIHLVLGSTPGPVSVNAHCGGCDTGIDITFNETVNGHNSISATSGSGQSGQANTTMPTPLTVSFSGASNATLTWRVTSGTATFQESGSTTYTPLNGTTQTTAGQTSSVHLVLGATPGPVSVTATCSSGCDSSTTQSFSATIAPPPTNTMTIASGNNQSGNPGSTLAQPLTVQFSGAPVGSTGVTLDWQVLTSNATIQESGSAAYSQQLGTSAGSTAAIHLVLGASAGPVSISATCSAGCTGTTNVNFSATINAGSNTISIFAGNNQNGTAGSDLAAALQVQFSATSQVTVDWQVTSANATIKESGSTTYSQSLSTSPGFVDSIHLTLGSGNGTVSVTATCSSGCTPSPQSVTFNATIGAGALIKISGDNQTGAIGSAADSPLVIQSGAAGSGISLAGQPVQWDVVSGSATLSAKVSQTASNGQASITFTYGGTPGPIVIQATVGTQSVQFNATSYAANVQLVSGNNQTGLVGAKLQPFTIRITPTAAAGKGLSQVLVSWSVVQGGGSLSTSTTYTDASGNSSNTLTLGPNPGTNVVQANIAGIGAVTFTATANANVQVSSQFVIAAGDNQALVPGTPSQPLVVALSTSQGQPIIGATVNWAASDPSVKLASASTFTGADGKASNTATVSVPGSYKVTATVANASGIGPLTFTLGNGVANLPQLSNPQTSVAQAIDKACPMLAGLPNTNLTPAQRDLLNRCSELVGASGNNPGQVPGALSQLINNKALPQSQLANSVQLSQFNNLNVRLAELRQGVGGFSAGGLSFVNDGRALPLAMLGDVFRKDPKQQADDEVGKDFERWGFFATGMIERGGFDANNSRPGFDFHNDSITAGVDYRFNADFVAGVAFGYNRNDSSLEANLGKLTADSYSLNGYFTWYHNNDFYVEGSLVLDWLSYDLSRNIAYQIAGLSGGMTSVNQTLTSSPDGHQTSLSLSLGKDFNRGAWSFSPYLRGVYSHLSLSSFSEAASDPNAPGAGLATAVDSRSMTSALAVAGGRISYTTSFDWGVLVPNALFEWNHELKSDPQTVVTRFLADPSQTPITITDQAPDQNYFNIGIGLNAILPKGRSGFLLWEHLTGYAGAHENRYSIGIRIEF